LVVGLLVMAGFAATLMLPIQLVGALLMGLLVGWLAKGLAKAIAASYLSGILGTILAGVLWGSATSLGLPFAVLGLGLGAIYGLAFGAVAIIGSLPTSLIQRHRRRKATLRTAAPKGSPMPQPPTA
jgi:lysylphosphatidylglycerol synthetase-like protein (DUF2156 family)